ncbi:hypothetical protein (Partial), partial [Seminavis robusta]
MVKYGYDQTEFIKDVRTKTDADGVMPTCPHCKCNKYIDIGRSRWIESPKILFGIDSHRYLDTKLYYCRNCTKHFNGFNKTSLQLDSHLWVGLFDFHLTDTFAVDAQLYSDIINSTDQTSTAIAKKYAQRVFDKYVSDFHYYLYAVRGNKVRAERTDVSSADRTQRTLDDMVAPPTQLTDMQMTVSTLQRLLRKAKFHQSHTDAMVEDDLDFKDVVSRKKNRNEMKAPLSGIGVGKMRDLIAVGVHNGRQLLQYDNLSNKFKKDVLNGWKRKVDAIFKERKREA